MNLKVVVKRGEGFAQPVTVEFPFRSPGIGAKPSIKIEADATEGVYQLNADGKAATGTWPAYVIAQADVGGAAWVASQMASIEVVEPFATATLARSACEQGKPAQVDALVDIREGSVCDLLLDSQTQALPPRQPLYGADRPP